MKPPAFQYVAPSTLDEALAIRAKHGFDSALLAGGQSLIPLLNLRIAFPAVVIDLGRVKELTGIRSADGGLAIGAMTRQCEAERSDLVRERAPLVAQALHQIGHRAIRNRGTIGGSLTHADPAAELPAAALALAAELVVRSTRGERAIPADDFFRSYLTTALEPDELLVEVRLPAVNGGSSFKEVTRRHGDFALVGAAAVVALDGGAIRDVRLVLMGVGPKPVRAAGAEAMLRNVQPGEAAFAEAAQAAVAGLEPTSDIHATADYRRRVAGVLARRALVEAAS
jgi:carbon-monoxide dehydrogenase medium subunit